MPTYDEWLASMVRSTSAAAVVVRDSDSRILLLHATYEDTWQLPGGTVEHGQDPWEAAVRELDEETGLVLQEPPQLLGVDWRRPTGSDPYTQYYFAGPHLDDRSAGVRLSGEHDDWQMTSAQQWPTLVGETGAANLARLLQTIATRSCFYLRDGNDVPTA